MRKFCLVTLVFGVITLTSIVSYPTFNTYAKKGNDDNNNAADDKNPTVNDDLAGTDDRFNRSHDDDNDDNGSDDDRKAEECKRGRCKCKTQNDFRTNRDVYAEGEHFLPLKYVWIYVTRNRVWTPGDPIGTDVSTDGVEGATTDSRGKLPCTKIWGNPLVKGDYDIVVDANCDGIFNAGDAVDGRSRDRGFRVK